MITHGPNQKTYMGGRFQNRFPNDIISQIEIISNEKA